MAQFRLSQRCPRCGAVVGALLILPNSSEMCEGCWAPIRAAELAEAKRLEAFDYDDEDLNLHDLIG